MQNPRCVHVARIGLLPVPCRRLGGQTRLEDIKNLSSYLQRGCEKCPNRNTKRGNAHAFLCRVSPVIETSHISLDDHFAALQIDLSIRGWIGAFATLAAYMTPISFRTIFCPTIIRHTFCRRTSNIIHFPVL